jgi:hypothetical protein
MNNRLFFDKRDHLLIWIVNSVYDADNELGYTRNLYYTFFHPLGIKELAESKGLRTAYSIVSLLASMERGTIDDRIQALSGLKDDILTTADGPMPRNTARVLLQIMKELVRAKGNNRQQLELAHDFRMAAFGKPRVIRGLLTRYHLLEMPEEWNQLAFDDHVHDANTSGRKSPTHLIMDAWIKGLRRLRVIYYHYLEPRFASELIQAAAIMDIDLRIGIELRARFRKKYISFIWCARGFPDVESFLCFLAEHRVAAFMAEGKAVIRFKEKYALDLLEEFNTTKRQALCQDLGIDLPPLEPEGFLKFISPGQPSALFVGEYIHSQVMEATKAAMAAWKDQPPRTSEEEKKRETFISRMTDLTVGDLIAGYLELSPFFDMFQSAMICSETEIPDRLKLDFKQMLQTVTQLHHSFRITLNLEGLSPADVVELLYDGKGQISRLEIINLKNFITDQTAHLASINTLHRAINDGSTLKLKMVVRKISQEVSAGTDPDREDRQKKLTEILYDIDALKAMYAVKPLKSRIGSDSTGRPKRSHGMGFAIIDTLPRQVARQIRKNTMKILPARMAVCRRTTTPPAEHLPLFRYLPGIRHLLMREKTDWVMESQVVNMGEPGNIVSLGRVFRPLRNDLGRTSKKGEKPPKARLWNDLNSKLKNTLKILAGFIPAFLCFALTKEWWLLAYLGAFIWFGITGVRNILQSVIGGGGIRRTSKLKWNDFVSWDRLADSLLFTGFSVPLLDWVVKSLVLEKTFGITMATSPTILYTVMAVANGIYLFSHNMFRGLPRSAATGNLFRSIFSIPVAILFSSGISVVLSILGVSAVDTVLQKWAAIISKGASDCVAGMIEGAAERYHNIKLRKRDIRMTFSHLFTTYSRLAQLFPENEELKILERPAALLHSKNSEVRDLMVVITINCLDLLYFWMYLPRAKTVMMDMFDDLLPEEKTIFCQAQQLLSQERYIAGLFVDGILGQNFNRPLSFYLTTQRPYLSQITALLPEEASSQTVENQPRA